MTRSRSISLPVHGALETLAAPAIMVAPFFLGLGQAASVVAFAIGALLMGLSLQVLGPGRVVPVSAHAGFDYVLALTAIAAGLAIGLTGGQWNGAVFLVGVGAAQVALTASTRFSVPAGA